MSVYNLGSVGRDSPGVEFNKLGDTLLEFGMKKNLGKQEIEGRKDIARAQGEAEAKTLLAKTAIERENTTRTNLQATWQSLSDKPETERKLFMETDQGKEYLKTVKKYLPELFDTNSNPIFFPSTKDTIKQELDSKINVVKNKLLTEGPDSLNDGERATLQMAGYKDEIAEVSADLYKNPEFMYLLQDPNRVDPKTGKTNAMIAQEMLKTAVMQRKTLREGASTGAPIGDMSTALGGENATPVSNQAQPSQTRFKVRKL